MPPPQITFFPSYFAHFTDRRESDMNALYENSSKLTESHYKESPWPSPDSVSQFFENGEKKKKKKKEKT